jgi:pre-rRNA-processing protein TSR3
MIELGGALVALDCSWKKIEGALVSVGRQTMLESRTLPMLLASNPVSWGKPGRLSTAEALAASLYLMEHKEQAARVMGLFPFGDQFMELNKEPLNAYIEARSREELIELQWEFFDSGRSADY